MSGLALAAELPAITELAVVIPAHNEAGRIRRCLRALDEAVARCPLPVSVVVVADSCSDSTAAIARRTSVRSASVFRVIERNDRCVGAARAAGIEYLLGTPTPPRPSTWLVNTDADSLVPGDWLVRHAGYAARGARAVIGTVAVTEWRRHRYRRAVTREYLAGYDSTDGHSHVHGANLGVHAAAYLACGGFAPLSSGEDVDLVQRLCAASGTAGADADTVDHPIVWAGDLPVRTPARRQGRAPLGFAAFLLEVERAAT